MKKYLFAFMAIAFVATMLVGCKPYDKPEYVFVNSNETAFVIPQFSDSGATTSDQVQVNSEAYFTKNIVNERTIQVPHRWIKTGRFESDGKYVPTVKVVKVSQTPIAGEWLPKTNDNSSKTAVRLETVESSGFQLPMRYTMHIEASDAAKYLANWTTDKPLQEVIDTTVNTWITAELNKEFHKLPYTLVSTKRDEIVSSVAEKAKTEFLTKGITIDVLAAYDGIYWDDSSIQQEIDKQVAAKAAQNTKDEELKVAQKQKLIDVQNAENEAAVARAKASTVDAQIQQARVKEAENKAESVLILANAQAKAIEAAGANYKMPETLIVTPEFANAIGITDLMKSTSPTR